MTPEGYADLAYRMRFELGPLVSPATLAEVKATSASERERLLAKGVSPQLLGSP